MTAERKSGRGRRLTAQSTARTVEVPVGLEKVLLLAGRDPSLRARLRADRSATLAELGTKLRPSERAMLDAASPAVLNAMIERIALGSPVSRGFRDVVTLAATSLAAASVVVDCHSEAAGVRPEVGGSSAMTVKLTGGRITNAGNTAPPDYDNGAGGAKADPVPDAAAGNDSSLRADQAASADAACWQDAADDADANCETEAFADRAPNARAS